MTDTQVTWLTQESHDRLKVELDQLIANRPVIAAEINDRREEGDLRENGGYHAAREDQGQQEARIRQLQELLNNAKVGEAPKQSGVALPGSVVKVYYDGNQKDTDLVPSTDPNAAAGTLVDDVTKNSQFNLVLGVGMENRVGSTRVVGVYGAEAYLAFGSSNTKYEYGNAASADNPVSGRVTESKGGSTFGFGVGAFVGVEWFCAPKVSLSGEYTWGLMLSSTGHTSNTSETWDGTSVVTTTVDGGTKEFDFGIDTGVTGGSVGINFYFH